MAIDQRENDSPAARANWLFYDTLADPDVMLPADARGALEWLNWMDHDHLFIFGGPEEDRHVFLNPVDFLLPATFSSSAVIPAAVPRWTRVYSQIVWGLDLAVDELRCWTADQVRHLSDYQFSQFCNLQAAT